MYTYRNQYTGERRRFLTLQRSPWQLVEDSRDDDNDVTPLTAAVDVAVGLSSILSDDSSSGSSWDSSSSSDNSFSGGGGDFGGGGSSGDW